MQIITLDFETYFDDDYTLKKLTTEEYIRDPRFGVHGVAVRWHEYPDAQLQKTMWYDGELRDYLWGIDWDNTACLCHHSQFDGLILSHHYGVKPKFWLDTLSMARVLFDQDKRNGLEALAERFNLQPKSVPYDKFRGKYWNQLDQYTQAEIANGACHDVELTWQIANYMLVGGHPAVPYPFPSSELPVIDLTIRMFTEPVLRGNLDLLGQAWISENEMKKELFGQLGVTGDDLRKDEIFAYLLRDLGVEPELKTTPKGNEKYAFAKSDWFMQNLTMHENQDVALIANARLKAQSSIYQSRAERLGFMATRGLMPVYLSYSAAHTRRWGGGDKMNWQNFPRPDPSRPEKGALRRAIEI